MNKVYSKVWNVFLKIIVVASELARSHTRASGSSRAKKRSFKPRTLCLVAMLTVGLGAIPVYAALPGSDTSPADTPQIVQPGVPTDSQQTKKNSDDSSSKNSKQTSKSDDEKKDDQFVNLGSSAMPAGLPNRSFAFDSSTLGGGPTMAPMAVGPGFPTMEPTPPPASATPGLAIGTGGILGNTVGTLNPTINSLLAPGANYQTAGNLNLASANFTSVYSIVTAGIPILGVQTNLLNLAPVNKTANGLRLAGNQNLTLLGGVTSGSYIQDVNTGIGPTQQGILGLLLPGGAPSWASDCGHINVGLASVAADCWAVPAAQNNQVLIGDGAQANGSEEVVIGTNAKHVLAPQQADDLFDSNNSQATGVPNTDYQARLGHSIVIGDNAGGSQNAQTILGADAVSDQPNSVALARKLHKKRQVPPN